MKSMTGFGGARVQAAHIVYEVNIKTVNGRFLETRFHLPRELVSLEGDFKKSLGERFRRGTVDVFVSRRVQEAGNSGRLQVDEKLAAEYLKAYQKLSKKLKISFHPSVEMLVRQGDIIKVQDWTDTLHLEKKTILKAFHEAVLACEKERSREGLALNKEMAKLLSQLEKQVSVINHLREEANRLLQEKYEQKIQARMKGTDFDQQRLMQEVIIQLDKTDINEELMRLEEHIRNYRHLLQSMTAEGKKMDFYTQELLREVNTIGSKSQVAKITQAVVEAKTIIERLREQVQNIE